MLKLKTSGVLIRISNLVFIQVIFIFAALALALYYSESDNSIANYYSESGQKVYNSANPLLDLVKSDSGGVQVTPALSTEAKRLIDENNLLVDISLLVSNNKTGRDTLIHLAGRSGDNAVWHNSITVPSPQQTLSSNSGYQGFALTLDADGKYIHYFLRPGNIKSNYALVLTSPNTFSLALQKGQGKILLLLFLFSILISLLIVNLISRGIRKPLSRLIQAFEKTANGCEYFVTEEGGDKEFLRLSRAFNRMSGSLGEKQKKLSAVNAELAKANESLIESESILTSLVDYSPEAIIVTDLEDQVIIYNHQAARDFGYNHNDMLGKRVTNLFSVSDSRPKKDTPNDSNHEAQEIICRRCDGGRFPSLLIHTSLGPEGLPPIAMLYFIKNISESRNYQEMILKLDRVASRGKMARDIAHEINNYLAILQGNLELLPSIVAKDDFEKCEQRLAVMKDTVARIGRFTDGLTQFSDENSEFKKEDLNQLVENLIAFIKPQNKFNDILIGTNLSENLPLVEIDAAQIQLLLVNLINNAAEAMAAFEGTRWVIISTLLDELGQNVHIKVADSGPGITAENISKLFFNRFSARPDGNGLGLITCRKVVDNHRGEISYHTGDESKAIFDIKIPLGQGVARLITSDNQANSDKAVPIIK
ncbi:MAG: ATP-binding protein [candidate division Zixibacteria bacterium]|nr:ATP-binding protein [candidate division Zixibacteria bacterium]